MGLVFLTRRVGFDLYVDICGVEVALESRGADGYGRDDGVVGGEEDGAAFTT